MNLIDKQKRLKELAIYIQENFADVDIDYVCLMSGDVKVEFYDSKKKEAIADYLLTTVCNLREINSLDALQTH